MAKKEHTVNEIYESITNLAERNEKLFGILGNQLDGVRKEIKDLKTAVGHIENDVSSVKEDMGSVTGAIYSNVETLKNHGRRITRLERAR